MPPDRINRDRRGFACGIKMVKGSRIWQTLLSLP
jgi:hypothetical protein